MALIFDLFLSKLPRLKAVGLAPGPLGDLTRVRASDRKRLFASIKYSPVSLS